MTVALLVDNQPLIGESVRRMLAPYADIAYHYCSHPASAFGAALEVKHHRRAVGPGDGDFDGLALIKRFRNTRSTGGRHRGVSPREPRGGGVLRGGDSSCCSDRVARARAVPSGGSRRLHARVDARGPSVVLSRWGRQPFSVNPSLCTFEHHGVIFLTSRGRSAARLPL